jgi:molybdenum cofactor cytidylyltransferase
MVIINHLKIVGVVPASGASQRMGRDKAVLELEGRTFVQRAVDALRSGGCNDIIVVVPKVPATIREAALNTDARVLTNPDPGEGPITSMRVAIGHLDDSADAIAWLPVDFPLVSGEMVRRLCDLARRTLAPLTLPVHEYFIEDVRHEKRGHPAIFSRALFSELLDPALQGGARTVVHRHLEHAAIEVFRDPRVATDVDTPSAYEAVQAGRTPYEDQPPQAKVERYP